MSRLPAHLDPFKLPMGRLARCPMSGCEGGLVGETLGYQVSVTCTEPGCSFRELHGPKGLVVLQADQKKKDPLRKPGRPKTSMPATKSQPLFTLRETPPMLDLRLHPEQDNSPQTPPPCSVAGCSNQSKGLTALCSMHYQRWMNCSQPDKPAWIALGGPSPSEYRTHLQSNDGAKPDAADNDPPVCSVSGCSEPAKHIHDLCREHHRRWQLCRQPNIDAWRDAFGPVSSVWFERHADKQATAPEQEKATEAEPASDSPPVSPRIGLDRVAAKQPVEEPVAAASPSQQIPSAGKTPDLGSVVEAVKHATRRPLRATFHIGGVPLIFETNEVDDMVDLAMKLQKRMLREVIAPPN